MIALADPTKALSTNYSMRNVEKLFKELFLHKDSLTEYQKQFVYVLEEVLRKNIYFSIEQTAFLYINICARISPKNWPTMNKLSLDFFLEGLQSMKLI
ncbi:MAG: hypothetical protein WC755_09060 [Candidatus Woesearchaeota archaeon]|jgi:hypothetical protein